MSTSPTTDLQEVYDAFTGKVDEDLTGMESLIFQFLKAAIAKAYKTVRHSLDYVITDDYAYEGYFTSTVDQDEIELLALWMLSEHYRRKESYLLGLKRELGTRDFNSQPDKKRELDAISNSRKTVRSEIEDYKQQFNTYNYN